MLKNKINKELDKAVCAGNLARVKALLSVGADVNFRVERNGDTLLHKTKSVEITKELLISGAGVHARNPLDDTPLHTAIKKGKKLELVRELLKHGAYVNARDRQGNNALNHAVKNIIINPEVIKELLEYGADINMRNWERRLFDNHSSSLDNALGNQACAELLIKFTLLRNFNKDYEKIIDLTPYKAFRDYTKLTNFLDDCVCEILQMKTDEVKDSLSLYEFVTNDIHRHVICNNQLSERLAKIDFSLRYPIYNDIILDKTKPFLQRADLLNKLSKIQFYTKLDKVNQHEKEKKIIMDYDSVYYIAEYLCNDSLLNFIIAFDDSSKQSLSSKNNCIEPGTRLYEISTSNDVKRLKL